MVVVAGAEIRLSWILPDPVSEAMPLAVERKSEEAPLMSNLMRLEPERLIFPAMVLLRVVPSAKLSVAELVAFRLVVLAERAPAPLKRRVPAVASTAPELVFVPSRVVVNADDCTILPAPLMLFAMVASALRLSWSAAPVFTVIAPATEPAAPERVSVPPLMVVPPV